MDDYARGIAAGYVSSLFLLSTQKLISSSLDCHENLCIFTSAMSQPTHVGFAIGLS